MSATDTVAARDGAEVPSLVAHGVSLAYDKQRIVHELDLDIEPGQVTVIVGGNGCGKSTLLKGLGRLLRPDGGRVELGEQDITTMSSRAVAVLLGLLPQSPIAPEGITVGDLVARGRYPHQGMFTRHSSTDDQIVAQALADTGTADLADRRVEELSGGQRQRVWIAMALAQQPKVLLLDEPTTYLDVCHQVELLDLLADLNQRTGTTVVMVLHDLNLAARYADRLVVMRQGRLLCQGTPRDVLTPATLQEAFGLEALVVDDPVTGDPMMVPVSSRRRPRS
ncbi:iron-enterobactin transporter ATP-binding protein [Marmoricola endophyticus]|uniref:Iron-enterobactin transporter ATP-binding protein n=1 Tax=Marmoricola endophyticus TaxID=2040280 RepID=A0A917B9V4_9ACTN|nr:ABC transporter ATP-binding protein [Marmoricola endophyticus]GGF32845.1 iron-enterobactin transporter ATP-binding protein [Marmoricola endophyticus]